MFNEKPKINILNIYNLFVSNYKIYTKTFYNVTIYKSMKGMYM